jgi:GntR family transcriptional repressor for pyruvate dehydrogenase complex
MLRQANKLTLFDDVVLQIQQLIQDGQLRPGDRLPPERELASQLGISRNTLRESLKALNLLGVLKVQQGGGTYINKDLNNQLISSSLKFLSILEITEILNLLEARKALEVASAFAAAERAKPKDIHTLQKLMKYMKDNAADATLCSKCDLDFHLAIAKASENSFLIELTKAIREPLLRVMEKTIHLDKLLSSAVSNHEAILAAIVKKDSLMAEKMMRIHLEKIEEDIRNFVKEKKV